MQRPETIREAAARSQLTEGDARENPGATEVPVFEGVVLGAGRSGVVLRTRDSLGRDVARKIFESDPLAKAVQYVFLGAPNPYTWNECAVRAAHLRRRVLARLVPFWFGDKLQVANSFGFDWNDRYQVFQLDTEFVPGVPPTLHHPMNRRGAAEIQDLVYAVMKPLQRKLEAAGFDGAVWQAGLGNPVALANFLRLPSDADDTEDTGKNGPMRWAWIDLESGVPALFPANPIELFRFYLPRSWKNRSPLFDDVDGAKLREYLNQNRNELRAALGEEELLELHEDVESLDEQQSLWKKVPRLARGLRYHVMKGNITEEEAAFYERHPVRWYARESIRLPHRSVGIVGVLAAHAWRRMRSVSPADFARGVGAFLISQVFRRRLAQRFVERRIDKWEKRKQLVPAEAETLRGHVKSEEASAYLTDFGVHVAIKPFVKTIEWALFPTLYASGLITETTLGIAVLAGGCLARTLYTAGRFVQALLQRRELPWVALGVGMWPIVGNLAYPLQLVVSSRGEDDYLAQFILYDSCTTFGRKLPIWGGKDTLTEHAFNHLPDRIVPGRQAT